MPKRRGARRSRQRGLTLIESLVAFAVVCLGAVSVIRLQRDLRVGTELSGQRVEAAHLGQSELERRRAAAGWAPPDPATASISVPARSTRYDMQTGAQPLTATATPAVTTRLQVAWADTSGSTRRVAMDTIVGAANPTLSAALSLRPIDAGATPLSGRAMGIPSSAVDIGQGRSAWRLGTGGRTAWLFDNTTGQIISRCNPPSAPAISRGVDEGSTEAWSDCVAARGLLLSGVVRTSLASPPDADHTNDDPEAMTVALSLKVPAQSDPPACNVEAQHSVEAVFTTDAGLVKRRLAVSLKATPASFGAQSWTDLADRFVAYRCLVPDPPGGWSGRATVVPVPPREADPSFDAAPGAKAWAVGSTSRDRRVCRYVPTNAAGAGQDPNTRHPADYVDVTQALAQQNFLLVRGDQACPAPSANGEAKTEQQQP